MIFPTFFQVPNNPIPSREGNLSPLTPVGTAVPPRSPGASKESCKHWALRTLKRRPPGPPCEALPPHTGLSEAPCTPQSPSKQDGARNTGIPNIKKKLVGNFFFVGNTGHFLLPSIIAIQFPFLPEFPNVCYSFLIPPKANLKIN